MNRITFFASIVITLILVVASLLLLKPRELFVDGGCFERSSPFMQKYFNDGRRITFCAGGDAFVGDLQSQVFFGKSVLSFQYAGYPTQPGLGIYLVTANNERMKIQLPDAGEVWREHRINIPEKYIGQELIISAQDSSLQSFGWVGLSPVNAHQLNSGGEFFARVLVVVLLVSLLLSVVLTWFLSRFEIEDAITLLLIAFGLYGYGGFFAYLISYKVGVLFSVLLTFFVIFLLAWIFKFRKFKEYGRSLLFVTPVALFALFVIFVGHYPFSVIEGEPWQIAANRWLSLPIDNWLPKILADQIWGGRVQHPMIGDWLSSDRPPLQTGIFLLFYPMMPGSAVLYQTIATMLQLLLIPVTWLFISMLGQVRHRVSFILVVCFSSLVLVNSLFVWPKLISATYLMLCFSYLWREGACKIRGFAIGTSAALAMLSHGGAFFALTGIFVVWGLVQISSGLSRKLFQDCLVWGALALVVMLPWSLYGRYVDPESGRLIKWHLAGLIGPSDVTVINALKDAYGNLSFSEWLKGRLANTTIIVSGNIFLDAFTGDFVHFIEEAKNKSFFGFVYSMWFLSPFVAMLIWVAYGCQKLPRQLWVVIWTAMAGVLVWVLLMFDPGSTVIHQGSFFAWIAIFIWSALVINRVSGFMYSLVWFLNISLAAIIYMFDLQFAMEFDLVYVGALLILGGAFFLSLQNLERYEVRIAH